MYAVLPVPSLLSCSFCRCCCIILNFSASCFSAIPPLLSPAWISPCLVTALLDSPLITVFLPLDFCLGASLSSLCQAAINSAAPFTTLYHPSCAAAHDSCSSRPFSTERCRWQSAVDSRTVQPGTYVASKAFGNCPPTFFVFQTILCRTASAWVFASSGSPEHQPRFGSRLSVVLSKTYGVFFVRCKIR